MRWVRDVLVEFVLAGGLTALVLGHLAIGALLLVVGSVMLGLALRGHRSMTFGARRKPSTT